jgi:multidrug resistance efflux pump
MNEQIAAFRWTNENPSWNYLSGPADSTPPQDYLDSLRSDKPQMRKVAGKLYVVFPVLKSQSGESSGWHMWHLPQIPVISELPSRIEELRQFSQIIETALVKGQLGIATGENRDPAGDPVTILLDRIAPFGRPRRKALLKAIADSIALSGLADAAAVMVFGANARKPASRTMGFSTDERLKFRDEYRYLATARRLPNEALTCIEGRAENWELGSFAEMQAADSVALHLPPKGTSGLGYILTDTDPAVGEGQLRIELDRLTNLYTTTVNAKWHKGLAGRRIVRRAVLCGGAIALTVWLVLPAPLRVTATVLTEPAQSVVEALAEDAFLRQVEVRAGDRVDAGDVIALFSSITLDEALADAHLGLAIEELRAQAALSDNNYGEYAISESRAKMELQRLHQIQKRQERLVMRAAFSGQVISALSSSTVGAFLNVGTEIARVQPQAAFQITLDLASLDAPPIQPGQIGSVWFRGMSGEEFEFEVIQPAVYTFDEAAQTDRLVARGALRGGDQDRLIVGLSGFAKVEIGQAPRIQVLSRYVFEYAREKLWLYLNIQI